MLKEVTGYQTTDGKFYDDYDKAIEAQRAIDYFEKIRTKREHIVKILGEAQIPIQKTPEALVEYLFLFRIEIIEKLFNDLKEIK